MPEKHTAREVEEVLWGAISSEDIFADGVDAQAEMEKMAQAVVSVGLQDMREYMQPLTDVMPEDFKGWHDNEPAEWPLVAAMSIQSLKEREEFAWEAANKAKPTPAQNAAALKTYLLEIQESYVWEAIAAAMEKDLADPGDVFFAGLNALMEPVEPKRDLTSGTQ